jgi:hypothetical protein
MNLTVSSNEIKDHNSNNDSGWWSEPTSDDEAIDGQAGQGGVGDGEGQSAPIQRATEWTSRRRARKPDMIPPCCRQAALQRRFP